MIRVARWASLDPTGFDAGDTNLGRYCGNSPLSATDATGLDRYVVHDGLHVCIIVDMWNAAGTQVVGYARLDVDFLQYYVTRGVPGLMGGTIWEILRSNAVQDRALLNYWSALQAASKKWFWNWYYNIYLNNCWDISHNWAKYGGNAGSAVSVTDYMIHNPDPGASPKAKGVRRLQ